LCAIWSNTHAHTECYSYSKPHTYTDTDAMHGTMFTDAEASAYSAAAPIAARAN
jgi:hypothetical protein